MNKFLLFSLPTVALLCTMFISSAQADSWAYVSKAVDGTKYYVNIESINKKANHVSYLTEGSDLVSSSRYTEAWWKTMNTDGSYQQIKTNFLCSDDITKDISKVRYSATNTYLSSPSVGSRASSTIPGTSFSDVFDLVCNSIY
jgi:hypothetical protein